MGGTLRLIWHVYALNQLQCSSVRQRRAKVWNKVSLGSGLVGNKPQFEFVYNLICTSWFVLMSWIITQNFSVVWLYLSSSLHRSPFLLLDLSVFFGTADIFLLLFLLCFARSHSFSLPVFSARVFFSPSLLRCAGAWRRRRRRKGGREAVLGLISSPTPCGATLSWGKDDRKSARWHRAGL